MLSTDKQMRDTDKRMRNIGRLMRSIDKRMLNMSGQKQKKRQSMFLCTMMWWNS